MISPRDVLNLAITHPGHKKKILAILVDEGFPIGMLKIAMFTLERKHRTMMKLAEEGIDYNIKHMNWNGALYGKFVKEYKQRSEDEQRLIWGNKWNKFNKELTEDGRKIWNEWQKSNLIDNIGHRSKVEQRRKEEGLGPLPKPPKKPRKSNQKETPLPRPPSESASSESNPSTGTAPKKKKQKAPKKEKPVQQDFSGGVDIDALVTQQMSPKPATAEDTNALFRDNVDDFS
jgi:hypothetical protein